MIAVCYTMRIFLNAVIILFVLAVVTLGIRSLLVNDSRYGWGMFASQTDYMVSYIIHYKDRTDTYHTGAELRGLARIKLSPGRRSLTRYGIGTLRSWLGNYTCYIYKNNKTEGVLFAEARVIYTINGKDEIRSERIRCPQNSDRGSY